MSLIRARIWAARSRVKSANNETTALPMLFIQTAYKFLNGMY